MITYKVAGCAYLRTWSALRAAYTQRSLVFGLFFSLPAGILSGFVKYLDQTRGWDFLSDCMPQKELIVWVTTLFSFFVVFRTNQAYIRFRDGCHCVTQMMSSLSDATVLLLALSRASQSADQDALTRFRHTLIRLVSLLNALCLSELSHYGLVDLNEIYTDHLVDAKGLGKAVFKHLNQMPQRPQVVLIYIQNLVADSLKGALNVPPPLLTSAYVEFGAAMINFHDGMEIVHIPFPFAYLSFAELFSTVVWFLTPAFVAHWARGPLGAAAWTVGLIQIFWQLLDTAAELDMPFGESMNDLDFGLMQKDFNARLVTLLESSFAEKAQLTENAITDVRALRQHHTDVSQQYRKDRVDDVCVHTTDLGGFDPKRKSFRPTRLRLSQTKVFPEERSGESLCTTVSDLAASSSPNEFLGSAAASDESSTCLS